MWTISELKERAKATLSQCYWKAVLAALVLGFTTGGGGGSAGSGGSSSASGMSEAFESIDSGTVLAIVLVVLFVVLLIMAFAFAFSAFLTNPLQVGVRRFLTLSCMQDTPLNEFGFAFGSGRYKNIVKTMFFRDLYTFLWSLLFIVPGIVKGYEYRMIPYILAENPDLDTKEVFELSKKMMDGEKANAFILDLSFIGWAILSVFTCGLLAVFYVAPYEALTDAHLYLVLRQKVVGGPSMNPMQAAMFAGAAAANTNQQYAGQPGMNGQSVQPQPDNNQTYANPYASNENSDSVYLTKPQTDNNLGQVDLTKKDDNNTNL